MSFESPNTNQENYDQFYSANPYEVLGLEETATPEDIKNTWMDLLKKLHPDVNTDPRATEITQNINNAYERLIQGENKVYTNTTTEKESHEKTEGVIKEKVKTDEFNFYNSHMGLDIAEKLEKSINDLKETLRKGEEEYRQKWGKKIE